jgi:threonine dehydrogenase-like Zn-dependent dehydrogenase
METALNGVWDAEISAGMRVCVVGAGVVGLLLAHLVQRLPGSELVVVDIDARKAAVCTALGLPFFTAPPAGADFDVVVHASGQASGLACALNAAGQEALVLELSWFGEQTVPLALGGAFHAKRLTLRSSQVGGVAPRQRPRWSHRRRLEKALELLADPALDALISQESPFAALPETLPRVFDGAEPVLCHRVCYKT